MGRTQKSADATPQEKQHFSHPHMLKLVNPAQPQNLTCNACELPNNPNSLYGCNSCQYFLHENCLNAPRFLNHSSHPSHPLNLFPIPTYSSRAFACSACGSVSSGFSFSCACCEFDIHLQCASCPSSILLDKHPHQLELLFGSPYEDNDAMFVCDVCNVIMNADTWLYYCAACDFASHLHCARDPEVDVVLTRQPNPKPKPNPSPSSRGPNPIPNSKAPNPSLSSSGPNPSARSSGPNPGPRSSGPNPNQSSRGPNPNQSSRGPNPTPSSSGPNQAVEMINAANEAHERLMASQIRAMIAARGQQNALDLI